MAKNHVRLLKKAKKYFKANGFSRGGICNAIWNAAASFPPHKRSKYGALAEEITGSISDSLGECAYVSTWLWDRGFNRTTGNSSNTAFNGSTD